VRQSGQEKGASGCDASPKTTLEDAQYSALAFESQDENQDNARVAGERAMLRARWRSAWENGAKRGFEGEHAGGSYPQHFARWPLDQRNSWFCDFNVGFHDRMRLSEKEA
jgi:hypothetical protein